MILVSPPQKKTGDVQFVSQLNPQKICECQQKMDNIHSIRDNTEVAEMNGNERKLKILKWKSIIFLFITITGWGMSAIFAIIAFRRNETNLVQSLSALVFGKYFGLLFFVRIPEYGARYVVPPIPKIRSWVIFFVMMIPLFSAIAYVLFGFAVQNDSGATLIQTMCQLHSLFPILFGIFVLKEKISRSKALGIFIMFSGCILLGIGGDLSGELSLGGLVLTLICIFLWGSTYTTNIIFCKYYSSKQFNETIYFGISLLTVAWCIAAPCIELLNAQDESSGFNFENVVTLNLATMFLFVSQLTNETVSCLYAQVGKVFDASILSPVTQLYNVYPILFCIIYYQETVTIYKVIGCTLTLVGAMYLGAVTNSKN